MPKVQRLTPRKVYTPGSQPAQKTGKVKKRGRPSKKAQQGTSRKGNYRTKYKMEALEAAVREVKAKRMTAREAAKEFNVPRTTIGDKITGRFATAKPGRPTVLQEEEEKILVERLLLMSHWGFPLTRKDTCYLIKSYLDKIGRTTRESS